MTVSPLQINLGGFIIVASLALAGCVTGPTAEPRNEGIVLSLHHAAQTSEAENNYHAAAAHYRNLFNRQPENLAFVLGLARNLRYSGTAKEALKTLEGGREKFSQDAAFLLELGKAKLATGNAKGAVETFKFLAGKRPKKWDVYASLGIAYDLLQSPGKAWEAYSQALDLSPRNAAVLNNMALSAALDGKIDLAIETLEGAGGEARKNPQIRQNLALLFGIRGDMKKAENIAKIDLDEQSLRHNLDFYSRLHGKTIKH